MDILNSTDDKNFGEEADPSFTLHENMVTSGFWDPDGNPVTADHKGQPAQPGEGVPQLGHTSQQGVYPPDQAGHPPGQPGYPPQP